MNNEEILEYLDMDDEINEKWLIPEAKLDDIQYNIVNNNEYDMVIKGCAGSGKTILALYKLARIIKENLGSYCFIVYTVSLKEFIKSGIDQLANQTYGSNELEKINIFHKEEVKKKIKKSNFNKVDYILIDEVQDLNSKFIKQLTRYVNKNIIVLGDDDQQLYTQRNDDITVEEISKIINVSNITELSINYRTPRAIARFAGKIINDNGKLENKCVKDMGFEPQVNNFSSYKEELDWIMRIITEENITDVAIIAPLNKNVEKMKLYFQSKKFDIEYKYNKKNNRYSTLDFNTSLPKLLTYHSSKGLEFDYVFLPMCEKEYINNEISNQLDFKNALFVACTRAKKRLYISYSKEISTYIK
ncbi:3'-5' exonuclease [Clostridium caseinilyticum]|uniref:3'-5' exonuclease n=1 Tax=Clostridium caseinilyticum TaxID=3350403 RepID=UPI0038F7B111